MAPHPRVGKALEAMKQLGFEAHVVKPVLKRLGKLYSKNFSLVEADNYRALADAILDDLEGQARAQEKKEKEKEKTVDEGNSDEESQPLLKRPRPQRVRDQEGLAVSPEDPATKTGSEPRSEPVMNGTLPSEQCLQQDDILMTKGKEPMSSHASPRSRKRPLAARRELTLRIDQPAKSKVADSYSLIVPKDEPFTDETPLDELPLAVMRPDCSNQNSSVRDIATEEGNGLVTSKEPPRAKPLVGSNTNDPASSSDLEIASSSSGEVKMSLSFQPLLGRPSFHMPSLDEVLKSVKERCSQHGLLGDNFSVLPVMKEMCQCFLELATDSDNESGRSIRETGANRR